MPLLCWAICSLLTGFTHAAEDLEASRSLTFVKQHDYKRVIDTAHIAATLNITTPFRHFNRLTVAVNSAEDRILGEIDAALEGKNDYNLILSPEQLAKLPNHMARIREITLACFSRLKERLHDVKASLEYVCALVGCTEHLKEISGDALPNVDVNKRGFADPLGLISTGIGIYNLFQTVEMHSEISELREDTKYLHACIGQERVALNKHEDMIEKLTQRLNNQTHQLNVHSLELENQELYNELEGATNLMENYVEDLIEVLLYQRIQPRFFETTALTDALGSIHTQAIKDSKKPVYSSLNELLKADTSFAVENGLLKLLLHVPLSDSQHYSMFRLVDAPIRLQDGKGLRLVGESKLLAVNNDLTAFQVLTDEDAKNCKIIAGDYICRAQIQAKNPSADCLPGLFAKVEESIRAHCNFIIAPIKKESVSQIDVGKVRIIAPTDGHVDVFVSCLNGTTNTARVETSEDLDVTHGCTLSTPNFVYENTESTGIKAEFIPRPLLSLEDLVLDTQNDYETEKLSYSYAPINSPASTHDKMANHAHFGFSIAGTFGFIAVIIFVGYAIRRACRKDAQSGDSNAAGTEGLHLPNLASLGRKVLAGFTEETALDP